MWLRQISPNGLLLCVKYDGVLLQLEIPLQGDSMVSTLWYYKQNLSIGHANYIGAVRHAE